MDIFCNHRIILTCGTGGVGKTTLSAAMGLAAAMRGRRVLVLTVDPARRLADALGVDLTSPTPTRVWPEKLSPVASRQSPVTAVTDNRAPSTEHQPRATGGGFLDALMLDVKRTFDHLIERYAPDPATARTILGNPLYRHLSTMIGGSQEYMAMEKLYEMAVASDYDCLIVDTPPTSHAVELLRAPQRLIRALTDSMLRFFLKPSMIAGKLGAQLLAKGADLVMNVFGRLTGAALMQEIADLLMSTVGLFGGFKDRAAAVQEMLRATTTTCCLVVVPRPIVIHDALDFIREVRREGLRLGGAIVNRCLPPLVSATAIGSIDPIAVADDRLTAQLHANAAAYFSQWSAEQHCIGELRGMLPKRAPIVTLPLEREAITSVEGLQQLACILTNDQ